MNHAKLAAYVVKLADDLVRDFEVPRADADRIATWLEVLAEKAHIDARAERQFAMQYRELGPVQLAQVLGVTRDTVRRRFNAINASNSPQESATA